MLELRSVDVFYGDAQALWSVDLDVGDGEIVCIVGPNGAGKSTLVQAIAGLLPVRGGSVTVDGADVTRLPAHRVCDSGVAIVPEGRRIFPGMSVADNLDLGAYRTDARRRFAETRRHVLGLFPRLAERSGQQAGSLRSELGAVREVCELILKAQGRWEELMKRYVDEAVT